MVATGIIKKGALDHGSSTSVCIPKCNIKDRREQLRVELRRELRQSNIDSNVENAKPRSSVRRVVSCELSCISCSTSLYLVH